MNKAALQNKVFSPNDATSQDDASAQNEAASQDEANKAGPGVKDIGIKAFIIYNGPTVNPVLFCYQNYEQIFQLVVICSLSLWLTDETHRVES